MSNYGDYPKLDSVRRVLVVKLRHHGDVLLSSPVFSALQQALPNASIDAYVYKDTQPMLEGHPAITEFHTYDRAWKQLGLASRLSRELSVLRAIRDRNYDLVINLTEGDRGAIVARYSRAAIRVGLTPKQGSVANRFNMLTHLVKKPPTPRHAVELNLDAVRRIGIFPETSARDLHFAIPGEARQNVHDKLRTAGIAERPFLHIHPTSRWLFKAWPERNVSTLIDQLHARGWPVVITAAPDAREREFVQRVLSSVKQPVALDLSGQLTLKELGAVIDRSTCVITLDSVPAHMASALKKPSVIIFGPSSEIEWGPWRNPNAKVVTQPMSCRPCGLDGCGGSKVSDCLVSLPVQSVLNAVLELYAQATIPKSMS